MGFGFRGLGFGVSGVRTASRKDASNSFHARGSVRDTLPEARARTQRTQYPLTRDYTLNHNIKAPYNVRHIFLNSGVLGSLGRG